MADKMMEQIRRATMDNYFEAIMDVLGRCPTEKPTWESVAKSLGAPEDEELLAEAYYTRKAYWDVGERLRTILK